MNVMREAVKKCLLGLPVLRKLSLAYCAHNELLPELLVRTPSKSLRKMFGMPYCEHTSQLNQDVFALLFKGFKPGFFIEIGANNGFNLSNTVYLEQCFDWTGILIEANPAYLGELQGRKAKIVNKAVAEEDGYLEFVDAGLYGGIASTIDPVHSRHTSEAGKIKVPATTLGKILQDHNAPPIIDFISIDIEGGELPVVEQLCMQREYRFKTGCIEHNFRRDEYGALKSSLEAAGYMVVWEGQTLHDLFFIDGRTG